MSFTSHTQNCLLSSVDPLFFVHLPVMCVYGIGRCVYVTVMQFILWYLLLKPGAVFQGAELLLADTPQR